MLNGGSRVCDIALNLTKLEKKKLYEMVWEKM